MYVNKWWKMLIAPLRRQRVMANGFTPPVDSLQLKRRAANPTQTSTAQAESRMTIARATAGSVQKSELAGPRIASMSTIRKRIFQAFDAGMPVNNRSGLGGRESELSVLCDDMLEQNKHGIIFGPRGSGKTSLARVFGELADEAQNIVLYHSASGDMSFSDLMRPFLQELRTSFQGMVKDQRVEQLMHEPYYARDFAAVMADDVPSRVILVLDEFDRILSVAAKTEIAALMKLLSDMRTRVRLLIVGIATNLEDLLKGHPSLRRHLASVPVGAIAPSDLTKLLASCANEAGITFDENATERLVKRSVGSPYHLRLFGTHAALAACDNNRKDVSGADAEQGLRRALAEWAKLNDPAIQLLGDIFRHRRSQVPALIAAAALAANNFRFSCAEMISILHRSCGLAEADAAHRAQVMIENLRPLLIEGGGEGMFLFQDSLMPQFVLLTPHYFDFSALEASASRTETLNNNLRFGLTSQEPVQ